MKREPIFITAAVLMGGLLVAAYLHSQSAPVAPTNAVPDASPPPSASVVFAKPDAAEAVVEEADAADEDAAVDPRCAKITEASDKKIEDALRAYPECKFEKDSLERLIRVCHTTATSLWAVTLEEVGVGETADADAAVGEKIGGRCEELWATLALIHENAQNVRVTKEITSSLAQHMKVDGTRERLVNYSIKMNGWGALDMEEPSFFDFDGNGDPEVMVGGQVDEEGYNPTFFQILGFSGGTIQPYAPAKPFDAVEAKDEDDDGRPDLATRGPYATVTTASCLGDSWPIVSPLLVARSLPDGTFSFAGTAAAAIAKKSCPSQPSNLVSRNSSNAVDESTADAIVCFRLWGATRDDAIKELKSECTTFLPDGAQCGRAPIDERACPKWVLDVAAIDPGIRLKP